MSISDRANERARLVQEVLPSLQRMGGLSVPLFCIVEIFSSFLLFIGCMTNTVYVLFFRVFGGQGLSNALCLEIGLAAEVSF